MSGIAGIQARIAAVHARMDAAEASLRGTPADAAGAAAGGDEFASVLAAALSGADGAAALAAEGADGGGLAGGLGGLGAGLLDAGGLAGAAAMVPGLLGRGAAGTDAGRAGGPGAVDGVGAVGGARPATGSVAAERKAPGQYGRLEPPAELRQYGNGRIPADALQEIGVGSHRLWGPAAQSFRAMKADAAAAGIQIGVTDSYRDYDTQVSLARRKGLYSQGGLAATPGTSNHGWGMAVDLDLDARAQQWMRDNGWRYGFVEDTPREPWHWGFRPAGGTASVA